MRRKLGRMRRNGERIRGKRCRMGRKGGSGMRTVRSTQLPPSHKRQSLEFLSLDLSHFKFPRKTTKKSKIEIDREWAWVEGRYNSWIERYA